MKTWVTPVIEELTVLETKGGHAASRNEETWNSNSEMDPGNS